MYLLGEETDTNLRARQARLRQVWRPGRLVLLRTPGIRALREALAQTGPYRVLAVDSLQTLAGRPSRLARTMRRLTILARAYELAVVVVGRWTRKHALAGPLEVEHDCDVVLRLEGRGDEPTRTLRATKNRHGATLTRATFTMTAAGLQPVTDVPKLDTEKTVAVE